MRGARSVKNYPLVVETSCDITTDAKLDSKVAGKIVCLNRKDRKMARVKVLLMQDVAHLGHAGEAYLVAGGYARNFLLPRGMAVLATSGAMKQAEVIKQAGVRRRAKEMSNAQAQAELIKGKRLLFAANAGENNRLYGSVTASDIAEKLSKEVGFDVDRRRILLDQPIRELGVFPVSIRLMSEIVAEFTVGVAREGENFEKAASYTAAHLAGNAGSAS